MTRSFKISGAALASIVDAVESMEHSAAEGADFTLTAQGAALKLTCIHAKRLGIIEATCTIADGPAEPWAFCCNLRRFKGQLAGLAKEKVVEAIDGGSLGLVLKVGRRRSAARLVDMAYAESPKLPQIPWNASATVPVDFLAEAAARSIDPQTPRETAVRITISDGLLSWQSVVDGDDGPMSSYEDSIECATEGTAVGKFTPFYIKQALGAATGACKVRMASGLPIGFEVELPDGRATIILAQRE